MKKALSILIVLAAVLALMLALTMLAGCSGGNTPNTNGASGTNNTADGTAADDPGFSGPANTVGNTAGNLSGYGFAAIQGDTIYFCSNYASGKSALCSVKTDGSGLKQLTDLSSEETKYTGSPEFINVIGDTVYYFSLTGSAVYSIKTNGKDLKKLTDDKVDCDYMAVVDGMIYYTDSLADYRLFSMKIDGTDKKDLGVPWPKCVNVVDGTVYYLSSEGSICSMRTDGTDQKVLNDVYAYSILVANDTVYYTNSSDAICSMKTDGTDQKTLYSESRAKALQLYAGKLYFAVDDTDVFSINTDGTGITPVFSDERNVVWINFVGDWAYYGNNFSGFSEYCRIKPDGTGKELLPSYDDVK